MRDDLQSVRHKELIRKNQDKFMSVYQHVGRFLFQNVTRLYMKGWIEDDEEQDDKLQHSLYDVTALYIQLYNNLEIRVLDYMNSQTLLPKQALDVLCSYAVAEEGTNTLYIQLV